MSVCLSVSLSVVRFLQSNGITTVQDAIRKFYRPTVEIKMKGGKTHKVKTIPAMLSQLVKKKATSAAHSEIWSDWELMFTHLTLASVFTCLIALIHNAYSSSCIGTCFFILPWDVAMIVPKFFHTVYQLWQHGWYVFTFCASVCVCVIGYLWGKILD